LKTSDDFLLLHIFTGENVLIVWKGLEHFTSWRFKSPDSPNAFLSVLYCSAPCGVWAGWVSAGEKGRKQRKGHENKINEFGGFFCLGAGLVASDLVEQRAFNALGVHKGRKSPR